MPSDAHRFSQSLFGCGVRTRPLEWPQTSQVLLIARMSGAGTLYGFDALVSDSGRCYLLEVSSSTDMLNERLSAAWQSRADAERHDGEAVISPNRVLLPPPFLAQISDALHRAGVVRIPRMDQQEDDLADTEVPCAVAA